MAETPTPNRKSRSSSSPRHQKTAEVSKDQVLDMQEVFNIFDLNHSGYIEPYELKVAMRAMGFDVSKSDVKVILAKLRGIDLEKLNKEDKENFDKNFENEINADLNFDEFRKVIIEQLSNRNLEDDIQRAFELFDPEKTGKIGLQQLKAVLKQLDEEKKWKDKVLEEMIAAFDTDGDGALSYEEYRAILVPKK